MDVSVIICTRNRADHLQEMLKSVAETYVPPSIDVELIVVDNGSTDGTSAVVESQAPTGANWSVRYVLEPDPGLSRARNRGVRESRGRAILFTDDDVRVPHEWIGPMVTPILDGDADAVAGGVSLAESLRRGWMTIGHTMMLADTDILRENGGWQRMVGANMAIAREVFDVIPGFDPELGPGCQSTGFHEETLFSFQLQRAGFRLVQALEVSVDHHPDADRILYDAFADTMEKQGRSDAYLHHHWYHMRTSRARSVAALGWWLLRLAAYRLVPERRKAPTDEGMSLQEMMIRRKIAAHRHQIQLIGTPRRYERLGHIRRPSGPSGRTDSSPAAKPSNDRQNRSREFSSATTSTP